MDPTYHINRVHRLKSEPTALERIVTGLVASLTTFFRKGAEHTDTALAEAENTPEIADASTSDFQPLTAGYDPDTGLPELPEAATRRQPDPPRPEARHPETGLPIIGTDPTYERLM